MIAFFVRILTLTRIDPRGWTALTKALILMDLRSQHYAAATASKPTQDISPLFLVVGQCLAMSASASLFLFARTDVWFFAFANLTLALLVLPATFLVEFQEVVLNPDHLEVLGHRPLTPRTYAASRLANLLFYFVLMYLALNLQPLIVGTGLRDAGPWYFPAYLLASLTGSLVVTAAVVLLLSIRGASAQIETAKALLAWAQIIALAIVFFGGQLALKDQTHAVLMWGAFPPAWVQYLPSSWLAQFVERAAIGAAPWTEALILALAGVGAVALMLGRLAWLNRRMHPVTREHHDRPMAAHRLGCLRHGAVGWLTRSPEERAGFWMCLTMFRRDPDLLMRGAYSFGLAVAVTAIGLCIDQFPNPCVEREPARIALPILAVYLVALAVPALVYNLTFCRDHGGGWLWFTSPLARPSGLSRGALQATMVVFIVPACVLLGIVAALRWGDPVAAALHAVLAGFLAYLAALASIWLVIPALPFSLPPRHGSALGLPPLPVLAISATAGLIGTLHLLFADQSAFWVALAIAGVPVVFWLRGRANRRLARLARAA
jgi:hypothetical protein